MSKRIAILVRRTSFDALKTKESLDMALIFGTFEQDITLIFMADGVYQLMNNQIADKLGSKDYTAIIDGMPFYDVETIYAHSQDLIDRQIPIESIKTVAKPIDTQQLGTLLNSFDQVINF